MKPDLKEVARTIRTLFREGDVFELRVLGAKGGTTSGYFNNVDALVKSVAQLNGAGAGTYVSMNVVNPELLARCANRHRWPAKQTTGDADIIRRRWLLIDCDPKRPAGISSTDAEHRAAIERARDIARVLYEEFGWAHGILADSGNGCHLLYAVDLPNDEETRKLIERVLAFIAARFSDGKVEIDRSVFNASRILKLYGSPSGKGDSTPDRPHRLSRMLEAPEARAVILREQLAAVAADAPEAATASAGPTPRDMPFDVERWMNENFIAFRRGVGYEGGVKYVLDSCPFNSEHQAPDSAVFVLRSGALVFKCLHNSCSAYGWRELREKFERPAQHQTVREAREAAKQPARVVNHAELLQLQTETEEMLFDGFPLPARGAVLIIGGAKTGKTLLGIQAAVAVARGQALFDYYSVLKQGPALIVEEDDPGGAASIAAVVRRSGSAAGTPLYAAEKTGLEFGPQLFDWLGDQFARLKLRLAVLDSYTALRGSRKAGGDLVKVEQAELTQLDELAKKCNGTIVLIHHGSKGAAGLDWTQNAAGSYAVAAATESQIHIARFPELDSGAERFVRIRGRHAADSQLVLRFVKDSLNYEFVLEGMAAGMYPFLEQIKREFGTEMFTMKTLCGATGLARATAYRYIERLRIADAVRKIGYGQYILGGTRGDGETLDTARAAAGDT